MTSRNCVRQASVPAVLILLLMSSLLGCSGSGADDDSSPVGSVLVAEPTSLNFGGVAVGGSKSLELVLKNTGDAPLTISSYALTGTTFWFNVEGSTGELAPLAQLSVSVTFAPGDLSDSAATLTVVSDADNVLELAIPVSGKGESPDNDGDGYTVEGGDCNDLNAEIYPGAQETCNGVDNNCKNGEDDATDKTTWYVDSDKDGYGDPANRNKQTSCTKPGNTGWSINKDDCNDTDAAINPAALEVCDALDNNCDGQIDEGFDGNGDDVPDCLDQDSDSYTGEGGDCNDNDPSVHPYAEEIANGIDDDCDGEIDENQGPGVTILSPENNAYTPPTEVVVEAEVLDDYDLPDDLRVDVVVRNLTTQSPAAVACAGLVPDTTGLVSCAVPIAYGVNEIAVVPTDSEGLSGRGVVNVVADHLPAIELRVSEQGIVAAYGVSTAVIVNVTDTDELLDAADVSFTASVEGAIQVDRSVPSLTEVGTYTFYLTFRSVGTQILTATVKDTLEGSMSASTALQVTPPACSSANLSALFRFDEGAGLQTTDLVNELVGTLSSVTWSASSIDPSFGTALNFAGTGSEVVVDDPSDVLSLQTFTIDFWFKSSGSNNQVLTRQALVYKNSDPGNSDRPNYYFSINANGFLEAKVQPSTGATALTVTGTKTALKGNTKYHLAMTFDGRYLAIYLNGSLEGAVEALQAGTQLRVGKGPLYIGVNKDTTQPPGPSSLTGQMDDLQILRCALPGSAIAEYYGSNTPHSLP